MDQSLMATSRRNRLIAIGLAAALGTAAAGILAWPFLSRQVGRIISDAKVSEEDPRSAKGFLDVTGTALAPDGITRIFGWATHEAGIRQATLIVDEERRLPLSIGIERPDVAAHFPQDKHAARAGFEGSYDLGPAVWGGHRFEVELGLGNGKLARLGPWTLTRTRPERTDLPEYRGQPFHVAIATSNLARGGAEGIKQRFGAFESSTMRIALTIPILYMRTTKGREGDWAFDPDFDLQRNCSMKDRKLAEDNLNTTIAYARRERIPILFTLNGGVWADSACDEPDWDLNDALEGEKIHCQWSEQNEVPADDHLRTLPGSVEAPEIARMLSYNVYNAKPRAYKKRNLQAASRIIAEFARSDPDLFVGINLDSDTYTNPFFEGKKWFDYNPYTLRQFREWLRGSGPYAADWRSQEIPNLRHLRHKPSLNLAQVGELTGKKPMDWGDVDPPREFSVLPLPYWKKPWTATWDQFRRHLVDLHYDELSHWVHEAGVPRERIFSSQGFHPPREPIDPFAIDIESPAKNYDTGGMSVQGAVPAHGLLGAILYGDSSRNRIRTESGEPLFGTFRRKSPAGWAVVEAHPASLHEPKRVPGVKESLDSLREIYRGGARFVSLMSWNGGSGSFRKEKGYVSFIVIRDTPLEDAIKELMTSHAGLPPGSLVWTFGTVAHNDADGWHITQGDGNPEFGRFQLRADAQGLAIMRGPELGQYGSGYRGLDLSLRANGHGTLAVTSRDRNDVRRELAALPIAPAAPVETVLAQVTAEGRPGERLQIEFRAAPGTLLTINKLALLRAIR